MKEKLVFCTLFNKNYLDRGIVMYQSLLKSSSEFILYIIAYDSITEKELRTYNYENVIVIPFSMIENEKLIQAKSNRTVREFLWTCSSACVKYVLEKYHEQHCTYIDADMYFYSDPSILLEELYKSKCDVGIIEHRYPNFPEYKYLEKYCGKYCVEFNTFINNENGRKVLDWWHDQCLNYCTEIPDGEYFGDQKYIEEFSRLFTNIHEYQNEGAGIAPWNVSKYKLMNGNLINKDSGKKVNIIFYHFHHLHIIDEHTANIEVFIRPGKTQKEYIKILYINYIHMLMIIRNKYPQIFNVELETKKINKLENLIVFLTCEPKLFFLFRKIYRYISRRKQDIIRF